MLDAVKLTGGMPSLAAHRYLGQAGEAPESWIAAADPVYLEPRLDHLCLHTLSGTMRDGELDTLIDHLNDCLGDTAEFAAIGGVGYIRASAMPVSDYGPDALHGFVPDKFLPAGDGVEATRRLQSEIEMALHDHPANLKRQADGLQPVNALWLWGGGKLEESPRHDLPPLISDDPLLRGFWSACGASASGWTDPPLAVFSGGGIAVVPEDDALDISDRLEALQSAFADGTSRELRVLTRDGVDLSLSRGDRWKFWRRELALPGVDS